MNDDALAAVVAAARAVLARAAHGPTADNAARWGVAARIRADGAPDARLIAGARSRWAIGGRLRG